jgi:hypothetical protein
MKQIGLEGVAVPPEGGDFIATPREVVEVLLRFAPPLGRSVVDPFAGGGAILSALKDDGRWPDLYAREIRAEEREHLARIVPGGNVEIWDWTELSRRSPARWSAIVTNPPFSKLPGILESCMKTLYTAILMPIDELAGKQSTAAFFNRHGPPNDLIPIPWRVWPHVRGVAWYVWGGQVETRIHIVGR